jgi:uncharacterized membrane-anchored protein
MNKQKYIILAILLQIGVLMSFVVRYEMLKASGTTVYVPLRGYDPTDIWRGDYVNLAYEIPYTQSGNESYFYSAHYLTPEIVGDRIVGVKSISREKPNKGLFLQISNASPRTSRDIIITTMSGTELIYRDRNCNPIYTVWWVVNYETWKNNGNTEQISIYPVKLWSENIYWNTDKRLQATIQSIMPCEGSLNIRTAATDRWFVPDGTGLELEKKIRENTMYAEWKVGKNGAVVLTNVIWEDELPKK